MGKGKELSAHQKRLAFNGLQSDEFRLSVSLPSWEKVSSGFASSQARPHPRDADDATATQSDEVSRSRRKCK